MSQDWDGVPVVEEHARMLEQQGITPSAALRHGIRSITGPDDLPLEFEYAKQSGDSLYPSLLFEWTEPDGTKLNQIKIPEELAERTGSKYLWAKDAAASLGVVRRVDESTSALIVEGTKQGIVAGIYAPDDYEVYSIAGCWMWSRDGVPTPHLAQMTDKDVIVFLDADAATNPRVYDAGVKLRDTLTSMYGAKSVSFVRNHGGKKSGLDDLIGRQSPDQRHSMMQRMVKSVDNLTAAKRSKPSDTKPPARTEEQPPPKGSDDQGRTYVVTNGDAQQELHGILSGVRTKWDGRKVFSFGGTIARLKGGKTEPQNKSMWKSTVVEACNLVAKNTKGEYTSVHPSTYAIDASYARHEDFTVLRGVKHAPFVRQDGTVCTAAGYDQDSQMYLYPSEDLKDVVIPDEPTAAQVSEARQIVEEWLYDFRRNVPSDADRANMIGLILTPFVRLLLPSCPMAIINGLQMGVGKNLLADGISIVYNGEKMTPNSLVLDEEEQRKQLTTTFQQGGDFFLFDESPYIAGKHLSRALTAPVWTDRILGSNNSVNVPNQATWIALGNQVRVEGDLQRRVYPINLKPKTPNPQHRTPDEFRHPDFSEYTRRNRRKILVALLTMVRGWFTAGQPKPSKPVTFGSFEVFEKTIGGILEHAGIRGFLDNRSEFSEESSFELRHWGDHLRWLHETFGDEKFTTRQVQEAVLRDPVEAEAPPGLEEASGKTYTRQLGVEYSKIHERYINGYRLVKAGTYRNRMLWRVEDFDGARSAESEDPGSGGGPDTDPGSGGGFPVNDAGWSMPLDPGTFKGQNVDNINVFDVLSQMSAAEEEKDDPFASGDPEVDEEVAAYRELVWDLESGDVDEIFRWDKGEYLTLSGYQGDEDPNAITENHDTVVEAVGKANRHYGWNQLAFDVPALVLHHDADYLELTENAVDLMLIERQVNPTDAKGAPRGYYGLDQTAKRYGHQGKTDDLKKQKNKYGGYHLIPRDVLEPYLHGDLDATRFVKDRIGHYYDDDPYIPREHEVQRRLTYGPHLHGFRVDLDELDKRLDEGEKRKGANVHRLHTEYGMPLGKWKRFKKKDDEWEEFKSPLASSPGKEWLEHVFKELGAPKMPRTKKSKEITTTKDQLRLAYQFYSDPMQVQKYGMDPDRVQLDKLKDLMSLIVSVTGERTVYQTIHSHLVGDRVHPKVSPEQASGRWSVTQPGLTVMGKRGGKHVERGVLLSDPGEVLIAVDLDQVDARAIAGHCQDPKYMELFQPGKDLHSEIAMMVFGRADGDWRDRAKVLGHGFNYGLGPNGAANQTGIPLQVAQQFHQEMTKNFHRLDEWKFETRHQAEIGMLLDNGFGRKMKCNPERAYTQAPALVGQGATRDIIAQGVLNLPMDVVAMMKVIVHDEIVFSVPEDRLDEVTGKILEAMQFDFYGVPITAGVSRPGKNWSEVYSKD